MQRKTKNESEYHPDNLLLDRVYDIQYLGISGQNTYVLRGTFLGLEVFYDNLRLKGKVRQKRLAVKFKVAEEYFTRCLSWWRILSFTEVSATSDGG